MPSLEKLFEFINVDELVEIASGLIRIPSPSGEESAVMDFARGILAEHSIDVEVLGRDPVRPNVVASVGTGQGPVIVFNGHLDTVPVPDPWAWSVGPFSGELVDGRLYGRGASDMKGSCAAMMYALILLRHLYPDLPGLVQLQLVADEERGGHFGTKFLIEQIAAGRLPRPDAVLVGEKSDLKLRIAERGVFQFKVRFKGKATHTAYARSEGINAVVLAARAVVALDRPIDRFHPAVGYPVISVNMFHGGETPNQVPAEAVITVDRRTVPGETMESVLAEVREVLDRVVADFGGGSYEILTGEDERQIPFMPANMTDPNSPLVRAMQDAYRKVTGQEPEFFVEWAGATDGRLYRQAGIDTVVFGPVGFHAHGPNEHVLVDSLVTQLKVYLATVVDLVTRGGPG
jgi:acetylornithine deacetylase/succinyl-diaminopimelate desuccinylase family protein